MTEIYKIKFHQYRNEQGIPCYTLYTIGKGGYVENEFLTPKKITIKKERVIVEFEELGIKHEFFFSDDVELFRRDIKIEENADNKDEDK